MPKITRVTSKLFAGSAPSQDIEQFSSKTQTGTPNYTSDPAVIQALTGWSTVWSSALVGTNNSEYKQDRNAVDFVAFYQLAYILQMGIPEWDAGTTYYTNSVVQNGGMFYQSLVDNNIGNTPPAASNSYWRNFSTISTQTILTSGSGTYTPPAGAATLFVRMCGAGGGGGAGGAGSNGGGGGNSTFGTFSANGGGSGNADGGNGGGGGGASGGTLNLSGGDGASGISSYGGDSHFGSGGQAVHVTGTAGGIGGGGGGGWDSSAPGGGGGAGGYLEGTILVAGGISYAVGTGGAGGSGGTYGGGNGGPGIIIIEEFY